MKSCLGPRVAGVMIAVAVLHVPSVLAQPAPQAITVTSPTITSAQAIPRQHTPDGRNDSPALSWTGVPAAARELMVLCEDSDAGNPPPFVHWVVYKIPATAKGLPEALPIDPAVPMPSGLTGTVQGLSGFRRAIYRGPAPLGRGELLDAAKGHIIGRGELVATYERK